MSGGWLGIEHEFIVRRAGEPVDFRGLLPELEVAGRRIDPGDRNAVRTPSGLAVTSDGAEAEYASPPVQIAPGFTAELERWTQVGGELLVSSLGVGYELEGVSTHLSVSVPDDQCVEICRRFVACFGPALMLLLDGRDSPGLLIRPRHGRIELGGDYAVGDRLRAAAALAVGGVRACAGGRDLPPPVFVELERAVDRYGWYLDREGVGADLYVGGRATALSTERGPMSAQEHLELAWKAAGEGLVGVADPGDLAAGHELVAGMAPLAIEAGRSRAPSRGRVEPPGSVFARQARTIARPVFSATPLAATWAHTVYRLEGTRPQDRSYLAVPSADLDATAAQLESGELDRKVIAELRRSAGRFWSPPRRLERFEQAASSVAFYDELVGWESLAPPERHQDGVSRVAASTSAGPPTNSLGSTRPRPSSPTSTGPDMLAVDDGGDRPPDRPLKFLPPIEEDPEERGIPGWVWWSWVPVVAVLVVIGFVIWGGDDDQPQVSLPPEPTVSIPPSTSGPTTSSSTPEPEPPVFVPPEGYGAIARTYAAADMDLASIGRAFGVLIEDSMDDGIFSVPGTPPGNMGPDVDLWDVFPHRWSLDQTAVDRLFNNSVFECGETIDGQTTVCAPDVLPMPAGDVIVIGTTFVGDVASEDWTYTYAVVFDGDGDPANNFQASPNFAWDYFQATDTWFVLDHDPSGWRLGSYPGDFFAAPAPTATRAVVRGNSIVWFIPATEMPDPQGLRASSFRHDGTFAPAVSGGDVVGADPTEPLLAIEPIEVTFGSDFELGDEGEAVDEAEPTGDPPAATTVPDSGDEQVRDFIVRFEAAHDVGDVDFLFATLDPVVIDRYGAEQCRSYLATVAGSIDNLVVDSLEGPTGFTYSTDGLDSRVDGDTYRAELGLDALGSPTTATPSYHLVDGEVFWFTDCGEPVG